MPSLAFLKLLYLLRSNDKTFALLCRRIRLYLEITGYSPWAPAGRPQPRPPRPRSTLADHDIEDPPLTLDRGWTAIKLASHVCRTCACRRQTSFPHVLLTSPCQPESRAASPSRPPLGVVFRPGASREQSVPSKSSPWSHHINTCICSPDQPIQAPQTFQDGIRQPPHQSWRLWALPEASLWGLCLLHNIPLWAQLLHPGKVNFALKKVFFTRSSF